ncbi:MULTISPECIES: glycosyltransferase family 4 protein [unclassified Thiomonas]|jgi:glycosyltransferase involved in cell wall biosynthesis|uniref:glycosyltransferase family 4 protein n=1 Tax=unclassified Thiomonas TaxID=2625466 RepID=UPI0025806CCF|nr:MULTISPECIES: glycosyltransferase family 4 protein [unclassified Thiomonas]
MAGNQPAIWFPAIRTGTGTDVFTERLAAALRVQGLRAEITWLPLRAEYAPWAVPVLGAPEWATVCHINTWLHPRFIPKHLPVLATLHHAIHDPALRIYKGCLRTAYHRFWIAPIERRVLRRVDQVVAVSQYVADMAQNTLCDVPMRVIYNGIDTKLFCPGRQLRQPWEPFRLLYVGAWKPLKGVDLLAPTMRELGDGFELHYTGGPAAENDRAGMPANMHDLGRLSGDQVIAAMQNADAFLFPSRSEGFGLVAAEAMACGLPVVATRGSSLPEVVKDGLTGLLCPQDDAPAFTQAIRRLAADSATRREMSSNAVVRARSAFSEHRAIDAYYETYRDVIAGFGGGVEDHD